MNLNGPLSVTVLTRNPWQGPAAGPWRKEEFSLIPKEDSDSEEEEAREEFIQA